MSSRLRLGVALVGASLVSLLFFLITSLENGQSTFSYLIWNLFLAWLPLLSVLWLVRSLHGRTWSSWLPLLLTGAWLLFLPNSFYMITDYIHLHEVARVNMLFDVIMLTSFILDGLVLGYLSLYLVHLELLKRLGRRTSAMLIGCVLLLTSFAIYIGRDLRWNTWDVIFNPASLIFDVSDRIINPSAHPQVLSTTVSFFLLLATMYAVVWQLMRAARTQTGLDQNANKKP